MNKHLSEYAMTLGRTPLENEFKKIFLFHGWTMVRLEEELRALGLKVSREKIRMILIGKSQDPRLLLELFRLAVALEPLLQCRIVDEVDPSLLLAEHERDLLESASTSQRREQLTCQKAFKIVSDESRRNIARAQPDGLTTVLLQNYRVLRESVTRLMRVFEPSPAKAAANDHAIFAIEQIVETITTLTPGDGQRDDIEIAQQQFGRLIMQLRAEATEFISTPTERRDHDVG